MDSFYKVLTPEEIKAAHESRYNFDGPNAFDFDLLYEVLKRLREGKSVDVPVYDFNTHSRDPNSKVCYNYNYYFVISQDSVFHSDGSQHFLVRFPFIFQLTYFIFSEFAEFFKFYVKIVTNILFFCSEKMGIL